MGGPEATDRCATRGGGSTVRDAASVGSDGAPAKERLQLLLLFIINIIVSIVYHD